MMKTKKVQNTDKITVNIIFTTPKKDNNFQSSTNNFLKGVLLPVIFFILIPFAFVCVFCIFCSSNPAEQIIENVAIGAMSGMVSTVATNEIIYKSR